MVLFCLLGTAPNSCAHTQGINNLLANKLLLLTHSLTSVSGAVLRYKGSVLSGSQSNIILTVGEFETVYCVVATGPVNASTIGWYDPQGQLVSWNIGDEVKQFIPQFGKEVYLIFNTYQQSQGGKYECRVTVPGNNSEKLLVCIGEAKPCVITDCYITTTAQPYICKSFNIHCAHI